MNLFVNECKIFVIVNNNIKIKYYVQSRKKQ